MKNEPLFLAIQALVLPCLTRPEFLHVEDLGHAFPIYSVAVHPDDISKIIGRKGANIFALKALVSIAAAASNHTARVSLRETTTPGPFRQPPAWSLELCFLGIQAILKAARLPATGSLLPGRTDKEAVLMLEQDPPAEFADHLNRWLAVMGGACGVRIMLDQTAPAHGTI